jgi:hypothetical protein
MNDVVQFERDLVIQTKTRHQTPIVHTTSIMHIDDPHRHRCGMSLHRAGNHRSVGQRHIRHDSGSSSPDGADGHNDTRMESSGN